MCSDTNAHLEADASAFTRFVKITITITDHLNFACIASYMENHTIFTSVFSHVQLSLSGAVRMAETQWENRQHLELYSCHTV